MEEGAMLANEKNGKDAVVTKEDIAEVMSRKTNVAVTNITEREAEKLLQLENVMHKRIIGQGEAIQAIASALRRARTGLQSQDRPIATFLFLGPTGVGKTETAKTLAEVYFGSEKNMTRLDMSEYQSSNAGSSRIQEGMQRGETHEQLERALLLEELHHSFHPELMNRFDRIVIFAPLTQEHTVEIAKLMTHALYKTLQQKGINLEVTESALKELAARGHDRRYGARPLRRLLQDSLEDPISKILLKKQAQRRDTILVGDEGKISVRKAREL